jgi:hypothetical protein
MELNKKQIMLMLGLKPEWEEYFNNNLHLFAEKEDEKNRLHDFIDELKYGWESQDAIDFINWHIEMTTPVFGEWNYTKYLKNNN